MQIAGLRPRVVAIWLVTCMKIRIRQHAGDKTLLYNSHVHREISRVIRYVLYTSAVLH